MWYFYLGALVFVLFATYCIWQVRRDYASWQRLSTSTAVTVWGLYILHAVFTMYVAWRGVWPLPLNKPLSMAVGVLLMIIGVGIAAAGILTFHSFQRMSGLEANELVTAGIYQWSRNPQNVGWFLALLGIALLGRSGGALLSALLFGLVVHVYIVYVEEGYLEQVFGKTYRHYRTSTPRYLGFPKRD